MKAVILAAGSGSRLGSPLPKAFLKIGGRTLIQRTMDNLSEMEISSDDVLVVTGFRGELFVDAGLQCVHNPLWRFPGTLSSFLTPEYSSCELLVIHGDLLWEVGLLKSVQSHPGDILVPVDPRNRLNGEAMKAEVRQGRIVHLSKDLPEHRSAGESMGVFLIRRPELLRKTAKTLLWKPQATLDDAVNIAAGSIEVNAVFTEDCKWEEIDTRADLERGEELFS